MYVKYIFSPSSCSCYEMHPKDGTYVVLTSVYTNTYMLHFFKESFGSFLFLNIVFLSSLDFLFSEYSDSTEVPVLT